MRHEDQGDRDNPFGVWLEGPEEQELPAKLRAIERLLEEARPRDEAEYLMGPAIQHAEDLDALVQRRWNAVYAKIKERAPCEWLEHVAQSQDAAAVNLAMRCARDKGAP